MEKYEDGVDKIIDMLIWSMGNSEEPMAKAFGRMMLKRHEMDVLTRKACDMAALTERVGPMILLWHVFDNICMELRQAMDGINDKEEEESV